MRSKYFIKEIGVLPYQVFMLRFKFLPSGDKGL